MSHDFLVFIKIKAGRRFNGIDSRFLPGRSSLFHAGASGWVQLHIIMGICFLLRFSVLSSFRRRLVPPELAMISFPTVLSIFLLFTTGAFPPQEAKSLASLIRAYCFVRIVQAHGFEKEKHFLMSVSIVEQT